MVFKNVAKFVMKRFFNNFLTLFLRCSYVKLLVYNTILYAYILFPVLFKFNKLK